MSEQQEALQNGGGLFDEAPSLVAAAHELKSPLALIRQLSLELQNNPQLLRESTDKILLSAERALRLTSDVTRHARLEDSFFVTEPLNPQAICEEVAHEMSPLYRAYGRQIQVTQRRRSPLVVANRDLLRRILLGFADNALHYSDDTTPVFLSVQASQRSGEVRLKVRDFGPNVATTVLRQTNDEVGARPTPLHSRPASSGLGLYLAQQFATAMRSRVGVTRHRDGASFYIDLPESLQLSLL